ncbi:peptidase domain-containing ABC transporter [Chryseobacterium sp. SSA4.19]|uniref:peptidase domain-containing ABC transporter n=1 Tax=Chryseobacterium sp. SSA4.19 TaxID=2919915 RepID=UPI001F4DC716|nr:peptidase domain-containing ABC transporter [Chryseobacterium sp. SSA4.19]MCJ8153284.1 peptidase domain-containing ABC transporter [Chryseobacterium sp. SSA4.19]
MKKFPNYRQLDNKDCGLTCLQIISKHYGKFFSIQDIRDLSSVSKEGLSLYELGLTSERLGLKSLPVKVEFEKLANNIPLPCVAHWRNNHYVVLYNISASKVYVSDPKLGMVKYSHKEFMEGWLNYEKDDAKKGVLLLLEPTDKFNEIKPSLHPSKIYAFNYFLSHILPYKTQVFQLLATMVLLTLVQSAIPFITQSIVDTGVSSKDFSFITTLLIANIVLIVSISIGSWIRQSINIHISSRIKISILSNFIIKLLKLPVNYFENKSSGDIFQRALDYDRMENFIMNSAFSIILAVLNILVFGTILFIYKPTLFIIFLLGGIIYVSWDLFFWNIRKKLDMNYFSLKAKNNNHWMELLTHIQEIKNNNYEQGKRWSWEKVQVKLYYLGIKVLRINQIDTLGANLINTISDVVLTFVSVYYVIEGEITIGMLIAIQYILGQLRSPLSEITSFISSYQMAFISFIRINDSSNTPDEQTEENVTSRDIPLNGSLVLKDVYFKYNNASNYILNNVSLTIPKGKITAIVGASGSGKTTLLKILTRLYVPVSGEFYIGSINMNSLDISEWRKNIGVVNQGSEAFKESIKDNIVLSSDYNQEKLYDTLRQVNLLNDINVLPLGINTMMGENGRGLSEGQKQRLMIARALYKDPQFLFLDEATNSLDSINENMIVNNLNNSFEGKTVVIIAHRLATIKKADNILVMDKGHIVEMGNEEQLLSKRGLYYLLFKNQMILDNHE